MPSYMRDESGKPSSMRLMSVLALLVAAALAFVEMFEWGSTESKSELVLYFLVAAFAPKAIQKFAEDSPNPASPAALSPKGAEPALPPKGGTG